MDQQSRSLTVNGEATTPPYIQPASDYASGSDEDPNVDQTEFRPRREASTRARVVIANACGVRNKAPSTAAPSPKYMKKERADNSQPINVDDFFMELEEDLKHAVKVETKPALIKKLEDEPTSTNETSSSSGFVTAFSDAVPSPASTTAPAQKRPREIFDCVLLTSRKETLKRRRVDSLENIPVDIEDLTELDPTESSDDDEIFKEKMKKWKNDKVKKNEDRCLLPETLRARIRPIGFDVQDHHITVDNFTREHMVTRQFMSQTYGGSPQEVTPMIGPLYLIDHNMTDFFYMNTEFQPEAPEVPGAPGLWFSTQPGSDIGVRRVFTKIKDRTAKNDNKWLYVGQYDIRSANPSSLTVAEWRAQPAVFHNKWTQAIVSSDWGAGLRIQLHGRKLYNRDPTEAEWQQIGETGSYKSITAEEVKEAYFSGRERMGVWTAKCIGYDNAFQQEISQRFTPDWVPMTKGEKKAWKIGQKAKIKQSKKEEKQVKLEFD